MLGHELEAQGYGSFRISITPVRHLCKEIAKFLRGLSVMAEGRPGIDPGRCRIILPRYARILPEGRMLRSPGILPPR